MNISRNIFFTLICLGAMPTHSESVTTTDSTKRVFKGTELPTLRSTGLDEVGFWVKKYRIDWKSSGPVPEQEFGTQFYAWYRTKDQDTLRDFVFVQFIRGCVFETMMVDGVVLPYPRPKARVFFGDELALFNHRDWVIDSRDADPAYWSHPNFTDRHALLLWGIDETSFPGRAEDYPRVTQEEPPEPRVFIKDDPDGGGVRWNKWREVLIATNTALQFKTCLYRAQDVPTQANPDTQLPEPIVCMWWDSFYVYDHAQGKMTTTPSTTVVAPECLVAPNASEKEKTSS